jgi:hypothetical protein
MMKILCHGVISFRKLLHMRSPFYLHLKFLRSKNVRSAPWNSERDIMIHYDASGVIHASNYRTLYT